MVIERQAMTVEQFDKWANLPENADFDYEFINGEIHHILAYPSASILAARMAVLIHPYVDDHDLGHLTGANGCYEVTKERYMPDVGYISYERMPHLLSEEYYIPAAPDLAVEVLPSRNTTHILMIKLGNYLAENTVVWVVDGEKKEIAVYVPKESVKVYKQADTLSGGKVLAGFTLPLKSVFK